MSGPTVWQDPPPDERHNNLYVDLVADLRANPGKWAYLGRRHEATARNILTGRLQSFRPVGDFEAVCRNTADRKADIYVRFVGKKEEG